MASSAPLLVKPAPLSIPTFGWQRWVSAGFSLALLVVIAGQLDRVDLLAVLGLVPSSYLFWLVFAAYFLAEPLSQWIIFRRLWGLPFAGIRALMLKIVCNEMLVGYSGEVYFYTWARRHADLVGSPFGAVRDVAVTSALVGNAATIALLPFVLPALHSFGLGTYARPAIWSIVALLVGSIAAVLWGSRIFAVGRRELLVMSAIHLVRLLATTGLLALMWMLVLPQVPIMLWGMLATLRQLIARLPFVPNKDIMFAGATAFLVGQETQVSALITMCAGFLLAAYVVVGGVLSIASLLEAQR